MGNIFYGSSWGGTATSWLAKVLSMHDDLQCYHGARYFKDSQNNEDISGLNFAEELKRKAQKGLCVGGIHGYHGDHMEKPITDLGGAFGFLTRDPIQRISSLFNHHLTNSKNPENFTTYKNMLDTFNNLNDEMMQYLIESGCFTKALDSNSTDTIDENMLFTWNIGHALLFESSVLNSKSPTFKMEEFTTNPEKFKELFNYFTQESLTCSKNYLDKVFAVGKNNTHRKTRLTSVDEFNRWRENQKLIFYILIKNNSALLDYYDAIGYPAIKHIFKMIEKG
ncbi:MAG: hypothetical protein HQL71_05030 [Magnetococcales bacterium]|nr:hypothetical protein [Magnetococcales bacterium]